MFNHKMKNENRYLSLIAVLLLTIFFVSCSKEKEEKKAPSVKYVKVLKIEAQSGLRTQSFPGMSQAVREIKLAFRVGGPLVRLPVDIGQYLKKGELIAEIDPRDYRVNVNAVKAQLNVLKAQLVESELTFNRYKNLYAQQAAEKAVYDRVKAGYESLKAQVDATAEKLQAAENALLDTKLRAPFSGYVDTKYVENYDNVQAKDPIVSFLDCSSIEVVTGVSEELLAEGIDLIGFTCSFDAYPDKLFEAELKELGRKPQETNQTYLLTVILKDNDSKIIKPGMAASISVAFKNRDVKQIICIPNTALVSMNKDENYVYIYEAENISVKKQKVLIGKLTTGGVEIKSGLNPGQLIVTAGAAFLTNNQKVKPLPDSSGSF